MITSKHSNADTVARQIKYFIKKFNIIHKYFFVKSYDKSYLKAETIKSKTIYYLYYLLNHSTIVKVVYISGINLSMIRLSAVFFLLVNNKWRRFVTESIVGRSIRSWFEKCFWYLRSYVNLETVNVSTYNLLVQSIKSNRDSKLWNANTFDLPIWSASGLHESDRHKIAHPTQICVNFCESKRPSEEFSLNARAAGAVRLENHVWHTDSILRAIDLLSAPKIDERYTSR